MLEVTACMCMRMSRQVPAEVAAQTTWCLAPQVPPCDVHGQAPSPLHSLSVPTCHAQFPMSPYPVLTHATRSSTTAAIGSHANSAHFFTNSCFSASITEAYRAQLEALAALST